MVIRPVVSEILGVVVPPPDASKLSKRADAISLEHIGFYEWPILLNLLLNGYTLVKWWFLNDENVPSLLKHIFYLATRKKFHFSVVSIVFLFSLMFLTLFRVCV